MPARDKIVSGMADGEHNSGGGEGGVQGPPADLRTRVEDLRAMLRDAQSRGLTALEQEAAAALAKSLLALLELEAED